MKMSSRSSVNVDEAGIDAGDLKLEAGTHSWTKKSSNIEFPNDELHYEHRQRNPSILS